jgi:hypothetical protein
MRDLLIRKVPLVVGLGRYKLDLGSLRQVRGLIERSARLPRSYRCRDPS